MHVSQQLKEEIEVIHRFHQATPRVASQSQHPRLVFRLRSWFSFLRIGMDTAGARAISQLQLSEHSYIYRILPITSYLAAISSDDSIRLVDPARLRQTPDGVFRDAHVGITSLASPPASTFLFSAGRDAVVRAWDVRTMAQSSSFNDNGSISPSSIFPVPVHPPFPIYRIH